MSGSSAVADAAAMAHAKGFMQDALHGRQSIPRSEGSSKWHKAQHDWRWRTSVYTLLLVLLALAVWESPASMAASRPENTAVLVTELVLLVLILADHALVWMHSRYSSWDWAYLVLLVASMLDLALYWTDVLPLRVTRVLRPAIVALRVDSVRRAAVDCYRVTLRVLNILFVTLLWILIFAVVAFLLFLHLPGDPTTSAWSSLGSSMRAMLALGVQDSIAELTLDAMLANPLWYALFFYLFLAVMVFVLQSLLIALAADAYSSVHQARMRQARFIRRQSLLGAFQALAGESKTVPRSTVVYLLQLTYPRLHSRHIDTFLNAASRSVSTDVDPLTFIKAAELVQYRYYRSYDAYTSPWAPFVKMILQNVDSSNLDLDFTGEEEDAVSRINSLFVDGELGDVKQPEMPSKALRQRSLSQVLRPIGLGPRGRSGVRSAYSLLIVNEWSRRLWAVYQWAATIVILVAAADPRYPDSPLDAAAAIMLIPLVLEMLLRGIAWGFKFHTNPWNIVDLSCTLSAAVLTVTWLATRSSDPASAARAMAFAYGARMLRLYSMYPRVRRAIDTYAGVTTQFLTWTSLVLLSVYSFAVVALELFPVLVEPSTAGDGVNAVFGHFDTFSSATISLVAMLYRSGWHDIASVYDGTSRGLTVFSIVFLMFISYTMVNMFVGVVVSSFTRVLRDGRRWRYDREEFRFTVVDDEHQQNIWISNRWVRRSQQAMQEGLGVVSFADFEVQQLEDLSASSGIDLMQYHRDNSEDGSRRSVSWGHDRTRVFFNRFKDSRDRADTSESELTSGDDIDDNNDVLVLDAPSRGGKRKGSLVNFQLPDNNE